MLVTAVCSPPVLNTFIPIAVPVALLPVGPAIETAMVPAFEIEVEIEDPVKLIPKNAPVVTEEAATLILPRLLIPPPMLAVVAP